MSDELFEPVRIVAGLRAGQVRFVLVGDLAASIHGAPVDVDRVEICVADDEDNLMRLGMCLQGLRGTQAEETDDPHRAVFRTEAGIVDCLEMSSVGAFADLEARATDVDLGQGVHALAAPPIDVAAQAAAHAQDPVDLIVAVRAAALEDDPDVPTFLLDDGDEFGPDRLDGPMPPWRRVWKVFEDVDRFLTDVTEGVGSKARR
jgi:hypothetical protein